MKFNHHQFGWIDVTEGQFVMMVVMLVTAAEGFFGVDIWNSPVFIIIIICIMTTMMRTMTMAMTILMTMMTMTMMTMMTMTMMICVQVPGIPFGLTAQTIYLATGLIIAAYHMRK